LNRDFGNCFTPENRERSFGLVSMKADQEILEKIIEILKPMVPDGTEILPGTDLGSDLAIDSLKSMEILAQLEDTFDISIPINVLSEVRTVEDLAVQIEKLL
jgi:acyl carrier protein